MAEEVIKTWAVKGEGIGTPDYAAPIPLGQYPVGQVYTLTDMGELVARLGSIDTFDRRGNVTWMDDFESSLNKWIQGPAVGGSISITNAYARTGANSCELVTGPLSGTVSLIGRYLPYPKLGKFGFEFSFSQNADVHRVELLSVLNDGITQRVAAIRYDKDTTQLFYHSAAGAWVPIPGGTVDIFDDYTLFNIMKLVLDFENDEYVRLVFNNSEFALSDLPYQVEDVVVAPSLAMQVSVENLENVAKTIYVDDVIITQNEPKND